MNHNHYGVQGSSVMCVQCGYDLSGSPVGGTCPECGTAVQNSIRRFNTSTGSSNSAIIALICGILGLSVCGVCGFIAIAFANKARNEIDMGIAPTSASGMATAGLVLGWISVGFFVLQVMMICIFFAAGFS